MSTDEEILFHHAMHSAHHGEIKKEGVCTGEGENPLCGDHIVVHLQLSSDPGPRFVEDIKFSGRGCVVSQASTSLLIDLIKGKNAKESLAIANELKESLFSRKEIVWAELAALQEIYKFPARIRCASLGAGVIAKILSDALVDHPTR